MRLLLATFLAAAMPLAAKSVNKLSDFTLADQHSVSRTYQFPKSKVTVITVADHKGSDQLAPWIERLYSRYEKRIDIDGVADVSMIPKPFHSIFRAAFKKQLTYSVMLDWQGSVVNQLGYRKGVANLYVIGRDGRILKQVTGPVTDSGFEELTREVDRARK